MIGPRLIRVLVIGTCFVVVIGVLQVAPHSAEPRAIGAWVAALLCVVSLLVAIERPFALVILVYAIRHGLAE